MILQNTSVWMKKSSRKILEIIAGQRKRRQKRIGTKIRKGIQQKQKYYNKNAKKRNEERKNRKKSKVISRRKIHKFMLTS